MSKIIGITVGTPLNPQLAGGSGGSGGNNDYSGKKWLFIGDSITEHNFRAKKNYDEFLAEWLGITSVNRGMSSTGVTHSLTSSPKWLEDLPNYPDDVDYISVMGALNDRHTPLGQWGDKGTDTVYGGVWNYFNNLIEKYPNKPIIYITSTPREYSYGVDGQFTEWVDAFIKTAHNFSIPVLDLYRASGLRPWNTTNNKTYFSCSSAPNGDGVHPNELGQEIMAKKIYEFAKIYLLEKSVVDTENDSNGDDDENIVWEQGSITRPSGNVEQTNRIRTKGAISVSGGNQVIITFNSQIYKVALYHYEDYTSNTQATVNVPVFNSSGNIVWDIPSTTIVTHIRVVVARQDDTDMTVDEGSNINIQIN